MSGASVGSDVQVAPVLPAPSSPARTTGWPRAERAERITNAVLALIAISVLAVAMWLEPSGAGHGTHTQLGLPECDFLRVTGMPCLSCGMTTAFAHTVRGQLIAGFLAQPFGFFLAAVTLLSVPALLWSVVAGRSLAIPLSLWRWRFWGPLMLVGVIGAWIYKILEIRLGT